jgi:hypothetical protein
MPLSFTPHLPVTYLANNSGVIASIHALSQDSSCGIASSKQSSRSIVELTDGAFLPGMKMM